MILFSVYLYVFLLPTRWHDCLAKRRLNSKLLTVSLSNAQQQVLNVRRKTKVVIFGRDDNSIYFDFKQNNFLLRWYGTPCNIFKDNRILKNDYKHGFKNFKICNICPKNSFIKFHKRNKKENRCMIRTRDPQIASLPFNQLSYAESYQN